MADEDDVPPLEDMSELLAQVEALKEIKSKKGTHNGTCHTTTTPHNGHIHPPSENQSSTSALSTPSTKSSTKSSTTSSKSSTGMFGFKKGFLLGNTESKQKQQNSRSQIKDDQKDDVPFIKKKENSEENLKIPEVQKMMSDAEKLTKDTDAWVTDDLLKKVEENEDLFKKMGERKYMEAINFFQKNPTQAMERYKDDAEVQEFFRKFMGIMGDHFSSLADKNGQQHPPKQSESKIVEINESEAQAERMKATNSQPKPAKSTLLTRSETNGADISVRSSTNPNQPTAEDERRMQEILSNPEIRNILMDQKVFGMIEALRSNPSEGQRLFATADSDTKGKIQKLVQCGLLQFQT